MGTVFSESWTGANGAAWPVQWTTGAGATGVVDIQSHAGRMQANGAAYTWARALSDMTAIADQELLVQFTLAETGESYPIIHARHDGAWSGPTSAHPSNGYEVEIRPGESLWRIQKYVAGVKTILGADVSRSWTTSAYKLRFQCVGTTIQARIWLAADSEPGTWDAVRTDSAHASGIVAFSTVNGGDGAARTITLDDLIVDAPGPASRINGMTITPRQVGLVATPREVRIEV